MCMFLFLALINDQTTAQENFEDLDGYLLRS